MPAASFDFAGALASGATPQAITNYLSSQGMGNLATTYFNQQPAAPSGFDQAINALKGFAQSIAQPITETAGSAVRGAEAAPDILGAIGDEITGNKQNEGANLQAANQTMKEPIFGENTFAGNSIEQNLGEAAKAGSLLIPGAAGENAIGPIGTAAEGAAVGGVQNAGQVMSQNGSAQDVEKGFVQGAGAGAGAGLAIPAVGALADQAGKIPNALAETAPKTTPSPAEVLASRTADATPDYSKKLVGQFVQNAKGDVVPRVNEGEGLTGERTVTTSKSEAANGKELANIKNYPDKGTALQKSQAIRAEISSEANGLKSALAEEDKTNPLDIKAAKDEVTKNVFDNMNGDAKNAVVLRGKVGDFAKTGITESDAEALTGKSPSSIVGKYGQNVADKLSEYDGTRGGLLKLRQNLDTIYEDARGKSAFGTDHQNALDEMHTSIRDYLNKELHDSTANTDVQASLDKQSRLFRAKDVLDQKAAAEAPSKVGRFMQEHPQARFITRFAERRGLYTGLKIAGGGIATALALKAASKK